MGERKELIACFLNYLLKIELSAEQKLGLKVGVEIIAEALDLSMKNDITNSKFINFDDYFLGIKLEKIQKEEKKTVIYIYNFVKIRRTYSRAKKRPLKKFSSKSKPLFLTAKQSKRSRRFLPWKKPPRCRMPPFLRSTGSSTK